MDGRTDGQTDIPSYRDAIDASKKLSVFEPWKYEYSFFQKDKASKQSIKIMKSKAQSKSSESNGFRRLRHSNEKAQYFSISFQDLLKKKLELKVIKKSLDRF